jgi:hypothetical protein
MQVAGISATGRRGREGARLHLCWDSALRRQRSEVRIPSGAPVKSDILAKRRVLIEWSGKLWVSVGSITNNLIRKSAHYNVLNAVR